jgi:hypothetical protein
VPNYNGRLQIPTEGALLMSRREGRELMPIDFNHRQNLRQLAEVFNEKMLGGFEYDHFLEFILTSVTKILSVRFPLAP